MQEYQKICQCPRQLEIVKNSNIFTKRPCFFVTVNPFSENNHAVKQLSLCTCKLVTDKKLVKVNHLI